MTDGENIGATRLVLEPASLAVYLARNLSPWYHDVPDIDVMGKLHAVKVSCLKCKPTEKRAKIKVQCLPKLTTNSSQIYVALTFDSLLKCTVDRGAFSCICFVSRYNAIHNCYLILM